MPKTLADARQKLVALTIKPANILAPTVTELEAGIELSCRIMKSDYRLSATASDTINEAELCAEGNAIVWGASNFEGNLTVFRYLDSDGQPDEDEDDAWDLLKAKGTTLWLVEREGPKQTVAWTAGDEVEVWEVLTDEPQKPTDRTGYIKRTIPLGVQNRWLGTVAAAG